LSKYGSKFTDRLSVRKTTDIHWLRGKMGYGAGQGNVAKDTILTSIGNFAPFIPVRRMSLYWMSFPGQRNARYGNEFWHTEMIYLTSSGRVFGNEVEPLCSASEYFWGVELAHII